MYVKLVLPRNDLAGSVTVLVICSELCPSLCVGVCVFIVLYLIADYSNNSVTTYMYTLTSGHACSHDVLSCLYYMYMTFMIISAESKH